MTYSENYYTSPDFLGRKDFINKDWGNGGPGGVTNSNYFSAKFIKHQWFDGGFYKFYTQFDDGMKLVIDGRLIIDKWENPAWDFEARADISAGWHTVEVYYQEKTGGAKISLSWELACKDYANTTSWCGEFYPNNYYGGIPFKPVQRLGDFWDDNWGNGNVTFELNNQRNLFSGSYVNQLNQLPTDNFTGYFTKLHYFPAATYTFITQADDNIQIFIDGENIISQLSCCNQTRVDKQLTAGNHLIQIRYKEFTGEAKLVFRWEYKDRNFPTGQIYSPSFNYQTISGSQFKVEATANDNVGTNNTGVAFVSFYAYYNNQLYFLGLENNDNIDNKYSALINLSNITSSQNIEFSIAVTDRAGNVTNVAGGSRWARYNRNLSQAEILINDGLYNYLTKRQCQASCDTEIEFHIKTVLAIWIATANAQQFTTVLTCQDLNYLQSVLTTKKNSNWYTSDEPKRLFLNAVFVLNERTLMKTKCKNTIDAYSASANFIAISWQNTNNKDKFIYDLETVFANRPGKNCIVSLKGCNAGTVYEEAYHIEQFEGSGGYNYIFDDGGEVANIAWHVTGGGINFGYAADSQNTATLPFIGVNIPIPIVATNEWWLMMHEAYKKNTYLPPQFYRSLPEPAENGSSWMDLFSSYEGIKLGKDLRENKVTVSSFANEYKNRFSKSHNACNEYVPRVPSDTRYWDDVTCNSIPTRLKN